MNIGNTEVTVILGAMSYCLVYTNRLLRRNLCIHYQGNYISLLKYLTLKVGGIAETSVHVYQITR
jgi:hypothetical protein